MPVLAAIASLTETHHFFLRSGERVEALHDLSDLLNDVEHEVLLIAVDDFPLTLRISNGPITFNLHVKSMGSVHAPGEYTFPLEARVDSLGAIVAEIVKTMQSEDYRDGDSIYRQVYCLDFTATESGTFVIQFGDGHMYMLEIESVHMTLMFETVIKVLALMA